MVVNFDFILCLYKINFALRRCKIPTSEKYTINTPPVGVGNVTLMLSINLHIVNIHLLLSCLLFYVSHCNMCHMCIVVQGEFSILSTSHMFCVCIYLHFFICFTINYNPVE